MIQMGIFLLPTEGFWASIVEAAAGNSDQSCTAFLTPTDQ